MIKKLPIYISLLVIFSCAKENLLSSDTSASQKDVFDIAEEEGLIGISITAGEGGWISLSLTKPSRFFKYQSVQDRARLGTFLPPGTEVSIGASAAEGYEFSEWSNGWKENPTTFKLNSQTILTAIFKPLSD
jgi:hypothetical protein